MRYNPISGGLFLLLIKSRCIDNLKTTKQGSPLDVNTAASLKLIFLISNYIRKIKNIPVI